MAKIKKSLHGRGPARSAERVPARSLNELLRDVRSLIDAARDRTAQAVNSALVTLYWHIGKRIREDILHQRRAGYGERILQTLSKKLTAEYGRGFSQANLSLMLRFAEAFPEERVASSLMRQLGWSHFVAIIPLDDRLKREFYAEMCRTERWSVRMLRHKISQLLYERTAVSRKPAELIEHDLAALRDEDRLTPDMACIDFLHQPRRQLSYHPIDAVGEDGC